MACQEEQQIDFVTLGMFIVDEIEYLPPTPPQRDIIGGAGSYSAVGARIFSPAPDASRKVGWIVDCGSDFPATARKVIENWQTSCLFRDTPERKTTRGWNGYNELQERAFKYLSPKKRLNHESLTPELLMSRSFHLICSPARCVDLVQGILKRRAELDSPEAFTRPIFIWEPVPDLCTPEELEMCYKANALVDVLSPNHSELCAFFGVAAHDSKDYVARSTIVQCCRRFLDKGLGQASSTSGGMVVRCGAEGCYVATHSEDRWLPAYHTDGSRVIDPTGGGNTFLGGFAVGLVRRQADNSSFIDELYDAALVGSVAASFAIEQVGMPNLRMLDNGNEEWNGESPIARLEKLQTRLQKS